MATSSAKKVGPGLGAGGGTPSACALEPDPIYGVRAGPWTLRLRPESEDIQRQHVAAYITVDGGTVAVLPCGDWPFQSATGDPEVFDLSLMMMDKFVVVMAAENGRKTVDIVDADAARAGLRGTGVLSLVVSGLTIVSSPRAVLPGDPLFDKLTEKWGTNTPYHWSRGGVDAKVSTMRGQVVIVLRTTARGISSHEEAETMVHTMRDVIEACRYFSSHGLSPFVPVLQLEGFIELRLVETRLGRMVDSVRFVPQFDPPVRTVAGGKWWNRAGTQLSATAPQKGSPTTGIVPLTIRELLALPWQRPPSLETWGYIVCSLGDVVGKSHNGPVVGMVARVGGK